MKPPHVSESKAGAEYSDPYAVSQQLVHGDSVADRTMHLWRFDLTADLDAGQHTAEMAATDAYGREFTDVLEFEIVEQPQPDPSHNGAATSPGTQVRVAALLTPASGTPTSRASLGRRPVPYCQSLPVGDR